jgi:hypothetical protein
LVTTVADLITATKRNHISLRRSLRRMEQRGLVRRAGSIGNTVVWTASDRMALSFQRPVLTCVQGDNADLMERVARVYIHGGAVIADVTYGLGVFWRKIDTTQYRLLKSDLCPLIPEGEEYSAVTAADFRFLPYKDHQFDVLVLDPPYMHGGASIKASINNCYLNANDSSKSVVELYHEGIGEGCRVLKPGGLILVKVGDEIESGKVRFHHISVHQELEANGFEVVQHFVLMRNTIPAMRDTYQLHARTNHSYLIIARKRRPRVLPDNRRDYGQR